MNLTLRRKPTFTRAASRMNRSPRFRSWALFVALFIGLAATGICFISINQLLRQERAAGDLVNHTVDVLNAATSLDTDLAIVISQGHLFIVEKGAGGIERFDAAATKVAGDIRGLRGLTIDNPVQQATLDRIEPLIIARVALLRELNARLRAGRVDDSADVVGISRANAALMEQIFVAAEELKVEERYLLGERQAAAHEAATLLVNYLVGYAVLTAVSAFFMTSLLVGRTRERKLSATNIELKRLSRHLARARTTAEHANQAKSRFLAGMSHELRTPLNGVLGYARLLRIEGGLNPTQAARVDAMLEAGKHLLEMVTCVLDLSEIEADHLVLRPVALDVQAIAAACLDLVRPMAEAKGLTLSIATLPGTSTELIADPTRLRQILLNLLGNAAKFTSRGGIEVRFRILRAEEAPAGKAPKGEMPEGETPKGEAPKGELRTGRMLRIEVADTGPGIVADQRQRLFRDFERQDVDIIGNVEGAGLGLALSSRLAGLMGGRLGHEDNPDGGSVFWLELPLAVLAPATEPGARAADGTAPAAGRALHVLVVDDVLMNRDIAGCFLRSAGHDVTCVDDGAEAVSAASAGDFDVILMDVRMPGMDGLEATRRIRALEGMRGQVPIVALTAQAFTEQVAECVKAGMDGHLTKPFDPDTLLGAVVEAVAAGRMGGGNRLAARPNVPLARAAIPVAELPLPVVDAAVFRRTAAFLSADAMASHMQTIVDLSDGLLQRLLVADAVEHSGAELAEAAHALAGSAAMFGFERLASVARQFEAAIGVDKAEAPALAERLAAALGATVQAIHDLGHDFGVGVLQGAG
jgi:signal transduction histidine kinase/CheY-like chemotaxis protein/HPt (histidine-containing phosphotransfer) domain-containing protein